MSQSDAYASSESNRRSVSQCTHMVINNHRQAALIDLSNSENMVCLCKSVFSSHSHPERNDFNYFHELEIIDFVSHIMVAVSGE